MRTLAATDPQRFLKIATASLSPSNRVMVVPVSYLETVTVVPSRRLSSQGLSPSMATNAESLSTFWD